MVFFSSVFSTCFSSTFSTRCGASSFGASAESKRCDTACS